MLLLLLIRFVYEKMGGALTEQLKMYSCHHMWELKEHLKNNVIPIGMVKYGVQCHRALLFKVSLQFSFLCLQFHILDTLVYILHDNSNNNWELSKRTNLKCYLK